MISSTFESQVCPNLGHDPKFVLIFFYNNVPIGDHWCLN